MPGMNCVLVKGGSVLVALLLNSCIVCPLQGLSSSMLRSCSALGVLFVFLVRVCVKVHTKYLVFILSYFFWCLYLFIDWRQTLTCALWIISSRFNFSWSIHGMKHLQCFLLDLFRSVFAWFQASFCVRPHAHGHERLKMCAAYSGCFSASKEPQVQPTVFHLYGRLYTKLLCSKMRATRMRG